MNGQALRLFSYKMTHDTGFAPNPFWGALTLATCKPWIRRSKRIGDWIAGFTSNELCGDPVGGECLVYLMHVSQKLPVAKYFSCDEYQKKIPIMKSRRGIDRAGDNIYRPLMEQAVAPTDFQRLPNPNHKEEDQEDDLSGRFVLIASRFVYFGADPLSVPPQLRPEIPRGQSIYGSLTHDESRSQEFIDFAFGQAKNQRIVAHPTSWPDGDQSWRGPAEERSLHEMG